MTRSRRGVSEAGVYLEGEPLREYEPPPSVDVIRQDIIDAAIAKGLSFP